MLIAGLGVCLGVVVAAIAPVFAIDLLSSYVTVPIAVSVYPLPLVVAAGFGMATSFLLRYGCLPRPRKCAPPTCSDG